MYIHSFKLIKLLFSLTFAIFVICISTKLVIIFKPLYHFEIKNLDIEKHSGFSKNKILENYDYIIKYISNPKYQEFKLPSIPYSKYGQIHFQEVKHIFNYMNILIPITGIISFVGIYASIKLENLMFIKQTYHILLLFAAISSISFIINFDDLFNLFHKIFFRNDYWIFDPKIDPVINMLPQEFFYHSAILILSIVIISAVLLRIISKHLRYQKHGLHSN